MISADAAGSFEQKLNNLEKSKEVTNDESKHSRRSLMAKCQ